MPETTPLIKAALNLRVGAGFDVYGFYTQIRFLKFIQRIFQKSFFTRNEKNDTA